MKQELQTMNAPEGQERGRLTGPSFNALFKLAGSESTSVVTLGNHLGLTEHETRLLVSRLQMRYLVDVVSRLDGKEVKETLRLTEDGEAALVSSLEQMCELPESI